MSKPERQRRGYGRLFRGSLDALRQRRGYAVMDLLVVVGVVLIDQTGVLVEPAFDAYPVLFSVGIIAVALMPWDRVYATGLKTFLSTGNDLLRSLGFVFSGFVTGLFGALLVREHDGLSTVDFLTLWGVWSVLGLSAHAWAARSATRPKHLKVPAWLTNLPFYWLAVVAMVHEHYCYELLENVREHYPPVSAFLMVLIMTAVIYLPVRMHGLIRAPRDPGNWAWFFVTCSLLTLWGVFGLG